jgi:hypothetical protein
MMLYQTWNISQNLSIEYSQTREVLNIKNIELIFSMTDLETQTDVLGVKRAKKRKFFHFFFFNGLY